jgi:hypothetical protein
METGTIRTLKIRKLLDCDRRIWIPHCIAIRVGMGPRIHGDHLGDRTELRPDDSKNQECCSQDDQSQGKKAIAFLLLKHFCASFLTLAHFFRTHENSLMQMNLRLDFPMRKTFCLGKG